RPAKTITYSLQVTDANNCKSLQTAQVRVNVTPPIKVTITPVDTVVQAGAQFQLSATSIGTGYTWTPATGLSDPAISNPVVTAGAEGSNIIYRVATSTAAGCEGEGLAVVKVYKGPELYVANAFTPNNDSKNDVFLPFPVGIKTLNYFRVFNRWGQLLYTTTTLNQGWDGKMGGKEQASDVYIWMVQGITQDGTVINKSGTVTLIR
ncbi:MAG: T9SS type B sorting domain-containing protein, partial [Chitinophagaceae bacterium]